MTIPDDLEALKVAYRVQYRLCCRAHTEFAYTQLTLIRYKAQNMAKTLGVPFPEEDFYDPTATAILASIARCRDLHTAIIAAQACACMQNEQSRKDVK